MGHERGFNGADKKEFGWRILHMKKSWSTEKSFDGADEKGGNGDGSYIR